MYVGLDTIAELSLALVGFSALLAMFRRGSVHTWEPRARLAFWIIVVQGFAALFFALLPATLRGLSVVTWTPAIALLASYHVVYMSILLHRHLALNAEGHATPNLTAWFVGSSVSFGTAGFLALALMGKLGGPSYQVYTAGVISCLVLASLGFIGVLRLDRPAA